MLYYCCQSYQEFVQYLIKNNHIHSQTYIGREREMQVNELKSNVLRTDIIYHQEAIGATTGCAIEEGFTIWKFAKGSCSPDGLTNQVTSVRDGISELINLVEVTYLEVVGIAWIGKEEEEEGAKG